MLPLPLEIQSNSAPVRVTSAAHYFFFSVLFFMINQLLLGLTERKGHA